MKKNLNTKAIVVGLLVIVVIVAAVLALQNNQEENPSILGKDGLVLTESGERGEYIPPEASEFTIDTEYTCPGGARFNTSYNLGSNELTLVLASGEEHVLPQSPTVDGARFASLDGRVVFLEKLARAKVTIGGQAIHDECYVSENIEED